MMRKSILVLFLLVHTMIVWGINGYQPKVADPMLEEWRFAFFPELDDRGVRCIASQSDKSNFWFGLESGVALYDGYDWKYYGEEEGLGGKAVQKMFVSENQKIYAASVNGIYLYEDDNWHNIAPINPKSNIRIDAIRELKSGNIVCATSLGVIFITPKDNFLLSQESNAKKMLAEDSEFQIVDIPDRLLKNNRFDNISDVFEVTPGELWIPITYVLEDEIGDIMMFTEEEIITNSVKNYGLFSNYYEMDMGYEHNIMRTSNGDIWIINKSNKIPAVRFSDNRWNKVEYGKIFGDDEYSESIAETKDGKIWISGIGNLYAMDTSGQWMKYNSENFKIPHGHIELHTEDNSKLWIYEEQSSVSRIDLSDDKWLTYLELNYQCRQTNGSSWFIDFEGHAIQQSNGQWYQFGQEDGMIDNPVSLYADSRDYVWVIGSENGVAAAGFLQNGKWNKIILDSLSWGVDYRAIFESNDGSIWLGGSSDVYLDRGQSGGLAQIVNPHSDFRKVIYHKGRLNGLNQLNAYGITQSKNGNIWIGGTGLCYFDKVSWSYTENRNLNDFVNDVHTDRNGTLYVGSRLHGLYILQDDGQWVNYSIKNGLTSNNIISLTTSQEPGEIWLATDKDISYFNGQVWTNYIFPEHLTLSYEGGTIKTNELNEIWVSRSPREWKRRVYTGRNPSEAIRSKFNTVRFIKDTIPPQTSIEVYSETVDNSGNTSILWTGRHFFNKVSAENLSFSYKINDEPWSQFNSATSNTFLGLANGDYTFQVRAMDSEGNIDPTPAVIHFIVTPPVWKQAWFILLIGSLLLVIGYSVFIIMKKQEILEQLNLSLQSSNGELESRNLEIEKQKDSLEEAVKKIDELSQAKVKFFTNITHEFRTPLSLILGPIDKLIKDHSSKDSDHNYFRLIKQNALRLQKLINQLLEVRRIEAGNLDLVLSKNDIVSFTKGIKDLFINQALDRDIKLQFVSDYQKLTIFFDQDKVEKILFNLISNAFKHTPKHGSIKISLLQAEKYLMKDSSLDFIRLVVEDNGTGLDKAILDKLFERFAVGHNDVQHEENSGIGLSYIKDLIEAHQGNIKVESELGEGTKFTVYIPENLNAPESDMNPQSESHFTSQMTHPSEEYKLEHELSIINDNTQIKDKEKATLLVVEDNRDMLAFIKSLLIKDYNVLSANNGAQGLEVLNREYIDLVISDIMMPKVDGITLCDKIKSDTAISHIPVILLTALAMDSKRIQGYESGADSYIVKPFEPDLLLARVQNLLESRDKLKEKYADNLRFKPKDIKVTSVDEEFLVKLSSLLEENVSDAQFDVTSMCEMVNMSHMHFIRKVKQLTGKKPVDLLKSFRLTRAKQLLSQNKINVSQVGYMVGYDLPNSFTRAFKNEFGISPTQFVQNPDLETPKT
ncbi:response regulator [Reichenbachiella agarivorans]|uniref:histidine kinase n=1 Tax=Reichenbachiella agarivorans TaxID=2979464 RepID=A0ABY6CN42_9BACT|nr:hybrid sensor histidine kinase/response regulator transcription factor [Reichenbachiella agarivorans]UXP30893.1 response regulator [Reichenbachiella agarivorans]